MLLKTGIFACYFLVLLAIGFFAKTRWKSTPESYFLADRKLKTVVLLATMAATNFSAFTVFGTSGAGYRDGFAFFPIMGFGTGFMALTFWIIGSKAWEKGKYYSCVTPPELIGRLYNNRLLSLIFALVMIIFTIPYLALQPMAAGYVMEELFGLPYFYGCLAVTGIILLYTLRGGMKAVAWTDLFQGVLMAIMLFLSLVMITRHFGGLEEAAQRVLALKPELFSRPGASGRYTPGIWFSFMMLWFFCDPMFPQLFQRFFAAGSKRALYKTMLAYPTVCTVIFIMPITIGVLGRLSFPNLAGKEADKILPMMLTSISGDAMAALVMAAGLAALMSTMDSQLLTLGSIFTRDIYPLARKPRENSGLAGRLFVIFLAIAGLALAYKPPATILKIATQTFTGLAVLFPTVIFGLYLKRVYALSGILSIIAGEAMLILYYLKLLDPKPFLPVIWIMAVTFSVYLATHTFCAIKEGKFLPGIPGWLLSPYFYVYALIFICGIDFWAWNSTGPIIFGLPAWTWYFVGLSTLQTLLMLKMTRRLFVTSW